MCLVHPIQIQEYANPPLLRLLSFVTLLCLVKKIWISMKPAAGKMDYKMFIFSDCNLHQILAIYGNAWLLWKRIATYDKLWQVMTSYGKVWQFMATYCNSWHLLATYGTLWQVMASFGELWQVTAT